MTYMPPGDMATGAMTYILPPELKLFILYILEREWMNEWIKCGLTENLLEVGVG